MDHPDQDLIQRYLINALALSEDERAEFLEDACKGMPALRAEVERLLKLADGEIELPVKPPFAFGGDGTSESLVLLPPGTEIEAKYCIVRLLARGGMGIVYEGKRLDPSFKSKKYALKQAFPWYRSLMEAEGIRQLAFDHIPHIPKVYDILSYREERILVMEFIKGTPLDQKLADQGRPFDAERVLDWAEVLLDTLQRLHTYFPSTYDTIQVTQSPPTSLHRDIKPSNLMVDDHDYIYLMDFGLARSTEDGVSFGKGKLIGTPQFGPPEQFGHLNHEHTAGSDLYALGTTLYYLLMGSPATEVRLRCKALKNAQIDPILADLAVLCKHLGSNSQARAITSWLGKAVAYHPGDRWPSALAMRQALPRIRHTERNILRYVVAPIVVVLLLVAGLMAPGLLKIDAKPPLRPEPPPVNQDSLIAPDNEEPPSDSDSTSVSEDEKPEERTLPLAEEPSSPEDRIIDPTPALSEGVPTSLNLDQPTELRADLAFRGPGLHSNGVITVDGQSWYTGSNISLSMGEHRISASQGGNKAERITMEYTEGGDRMIVPIDIDADGEGVFTVEPTMTDVDIYVEIGR